MKILAIDPGPTESAFVELSGGAIGGKTKIENSALLEVLRGIVRYETVVIEMIASYGMAVGAEVFETCLWIGRFQEAAQWRGMDVERVYRKDIKLHLCGTYRAKDPNIRAALIDRYGGKDVAIGNKKNPGPLYGFSGDTWAALALGVTFLDQQAKAVA